MSERRPSQSQAAPQLPPRPQAAQPSPRQATPPIPPRPSPPRDQRTPSPSAHAPQRSSQQPASRQSPPSQPSSSTHSRTPSSCTPGHSRSPSSSTASRQRASSRAAQPPDPTQDVLTAGDGLASSLGVSPPTTTAHLAAADARRRSSPTYEGELSGGTAEGKQGPADGLTGFDPAAGYQDSGSGGAFTAQGGLTLVPTNAPALMYGGGPK